MNTTNPIRLILLVFWMFIGNVAADGEIPDLNNGAGGFICGPDITCDPWTQYCYVMTGGPKGVPHGHSCVDVSNVPPPLTCETIPDIGVGCECEELDSGVMVTCTAP